MSSCSGPNGEGHLMPIRPEMRAKYRSKVMENAKVFVRSIYSRHHAGCCWHVVLDDANIYRDFIRSCAARALVETIDDGPHPDCVGLAQISEILSLTQFCKLAKLPSEERLRER